MCTPGDAVNVYDVRGRAENLLICHMILFSI